MKVTELMIGDWVNYAHKYMSKAMLCEVVAINNPSGEVILRNLRSDKVDEFGNKDYEVITTRYEDISPIPLTAEILEKNGFKYDGGEIWDIRWDDEDGHHCMNLRKMYRKSDGVWDSLGIMMGGQVSLIKSIHELQHALRLCGLNELADNFIIE